MPKFPIDAPIRKVIKSYLRTILTQSGISRNEFLDAYYRK